MARSTTGAKKERRGLFRRFRKSSTRSVGGQPSAKSPSVSADHGSVETPETEDDHHDHTHTTDVNAPPIGNIDVQEKEHNKNTKSSSSGATSSSKSNNANDDESLRTEDRPVVANALVKDLWDDDDVTVEESLMKLVELCSDGDGKISAAKAKNRKHVGRIGGPIAIVKAMERHGGHPDIQARGCVALMSLADDDEVEHLVNEVGGIETVILAMTNFPDHAYLQETGCYFIKHLVCRSKSSRDLVAENNGITTTVTAMNSHPANSNIQINACDALNNLASLGGKEMVEAIFIAGGLSAIASAAETHINDRKVKESAGVALAGLSGALGV